ncbi:MAG: deoxyguanosinetriphosphate triphosphohydrolase [Nevskia sp.]|nr:deoxyguanosinetriphosphate triphosphohydrolase [Nevskia sp.]
MTLAPYAAREDRSRGRRHPEAPPQGRSEYQRDRDRIIHSAAFRRLEYKTQVFVSHEGDLYRNRLTHSLEVAQITRSLARGLHLNEDLAETIALAHDLGHTPFGHAGQDALDDCLKVHGGFEHNAQSLRVVDELEDKYADFRGLNLTFETREGILKHCSLSRAATLGDVGERFLSKQQPGLEAQLTNIADQIAYNNHDVDDGLRAGLLSIEQMCEVPLFSRFHAEVVARYTALAPRQLRHETIRRMINALVIDLHTETARRLAELDLTDIDAVRSHGKPLVSFSAEMQRDNRDLKRYLSEHLYQHHQVYRVMHKARRIVRELFEALHADIRLLPPEFHAAARAAAATAGETGQARVVADYVAGMTDRYAQDEHARLYDLRQLR